MTDADLPREFYDARVSPQHREATAAERPVRRIGEGA